MFRIGDWTVAPDSREVTRGGTAVRLSPKAMSVLVELEAAGGRVLSRAELLQRVWPGVTVGEEVLTQAVTELRRAFGDKARTPSVIETVHKSGYRLLLASEPLQAPSPIVEEKDEEPADRPAPDGERKRITVLAASLGSSSAALAQGDPEAADRLLHAFAAVISGAAERHSGVMMNRLNDRLMFLFGAPAALEDHALLAVSAAIEMPGAIAVSPELAHLKQAFRAALSSGEMVVRCGAGAIADLSAVGHPATQAETLLLATPAGEVHLDHGTRRRAGSTIAVTEVAGNPEVFRLTGLSGTASRFSREFERGLTRFAGRAFELNLLRHGAHMAEQGAGQVIAVSGEPGIGKSRLFHEALQELPGSWLKLGIQISNAEDAPSRAVAAMVRSLLEIDAADDSGLALDQLSHGLGERPDLVPALADLLYLPVSDASFDALDPEDRLVQTAAAVGQALVDRAQGQPIALVVEDLHWIDPRTERLLQAIMSRVPTARILLLLNWRPDYRPPWDSVPAMTQKRLEALSVDDGATLVHALKPDAPDDFATWLSRRSQGNPLFIEESARAIGTITDPGSIPVPESVHEVLAARIDLLEPDEKALLQAFSVIGRESGIDVIAAAGGFSESRTLALLAHLNAADFVFETSTGKQRRFATKHAMTQDVAYSGLLSDRRAALHRRVAQAIETGSPGPEDAASLARHWTEAGEAVRAVPYWLAAGQDAVEKSADPAAIRWLESGLALVPALPEEKRDSTELQFLVELGVPLGRRFGVGSDEVGKVYRRADVLWRRLENPPEAVSAAFGFWLYHCARSDYRRGKLLADDLLALAEASGDPHAMVQARHAQWGTLFDLGLFGQSLSNIDALLEEGRPVADRRDPFSGHDPFVCALGHGGLALWIQGRATRADDFIRRARQVADDLDHPPSSAHALLYGMKLLLCRREPQPMLIAAAELSRLAEPHGLAEYGALAVSMSSWARARIGDESGLDELRDSLAAYRGYGRIGYEAKLDAECALLCAESGRVDEALRRLEHSFEVSRNGRMTYWLAEFHRVHGVVNLLASPEATDAAEADFLEAMRVADAQGAIHLGLRAATSMGELYRRTSRPFEAMQLLDNWLSRLPESDDHPDQSTARRLQDKIENQNKTLE